MKTNDRSPESRSNSLRRVLPWVVVGALVLGVLAVMPSVWALPQQAPDFQTVPTLTPTRPAGATATPPRPAGATATPTEPGGPTDTPAPGATPTETPGAGTPTVTPGTATVTATVTVALTPSVTPTRLGTALAPVGPNDCWTVPTPGVEQERMQGLEFVADSDQRLVVPGQTLKLRLTATNLGDKTIEDVLICNPLDQGLQRGTPKVSQGKASLVSEGLVVEVGDLLPGIKATAEMSLTIPVGFPPGGVIDDQAWLFAEGQRASTDLLTWALPPAYLPPTGE